MRKWRQWQTASDSDWALALAREAVVRPLVDQAPLTQAVVQLAAGQLGLSRATVYRLVSRYRRRPQTSSLLPWKRGRDSKTQFLDRENEGLIATCIKDFYLTPQRPSFAALFREVRRRYVSALYQRKRKRSPYGPCEGQSLSLRFKCHELSAVNRPKPDHEKPALRAARRRSGGQSRN